MTPEAIAVFAKQRTCGEIRTTEVLSPFEQALLLGYEAKSEPSSGHKLFDWQDRRGDRPWLIQTTARAGTS